MKKIALIIYGIGSSLNGFSQISTNGLHFDGGTQQVAIVQGYTSTNAIDTGNFTMEAWVRDEAFDPGFSTEEPILDNRENSPGPNYGFRFAITDGNLVFFVGLNGAGANSADLRDSACHHVAITRNSGNINFYVDGQVIGSAYNNSSLDSDAPSLYIGAKDQGNFSGAVWSFNGLVKEIRIWNIARTQSQIQANMDSVLNPNVNLISYWRCSEGNGSTLQDYSGNGNNGIVGAGWSTGCPTCNLPSGNITANGSLTFCSGSSVNLTATTGAGLSYLWKKNGAAIAGATQSVYTANTSGNYICIITNSCGSIASNLLTVTVQTVPSITISSGSTVLCIGGYVHISSNATAGSSYQWKLNGAAVAGATAFYYNATVIGNYTCSASNSCGDTVSNIITVTTGTPPPATITAAGATTFCNGKSVVINANTGTGYSYNWLKDGNYIPSASTSSYTATQTGNYQVRISIAYSGCSTTSSGIQVTVTPSTTPANLAPPGPIVNCGGNVVLNANTGTGLTYKWKSYGILISGATFSAYTAAANGDYTVEITNSNGCLSISANVLVTVAPPVGVIGTSGNTTFCSGNSVWLSTAWQPEITRQWKLNGSVIPGATNSTWLATAGGSYTAMVTNACGSSNSSSLIVTVNPLPSSTITPTGPATFCSGSSLVLNATAGANKSYQWKKGTSIIPGATLSSYSATTGGNYRVIVTNTVTGCSKTTAGSTVVTVNALPPATITPQGPTTFCSGDSVLLKANFNSSYIYQWKQNNANISGANTNKYEAKTAGNYKVKVTNANGCTKLSNVVAVNIPCRENDSQQALTMNFDAHAFPNPSSGDFTIEVENGSPGNASLSVYDITGRQILKSSLHKKNNENIEPFIISDKALQAGLFYVVFTNGSIQKVIKIIKN